MHLKGSRYRFLSLFILALVVSASLDVLNFPVYSQSEPVSPTGEQELTDRILEQFRPNLGWLVGLLSLTILAYKTLLKQWIEDILKSIWNWIYQKFSGTRLLRNFALRQYRASLARSYSQLAMPFLKNRKPLEIEEVYVSLKVAFLINEANAESSATGEGKREQIDAHRAIANYQRLIIIGRPGSGKSVFLKYLAWSYGSGKLTSIPNRPTVVLLELYRVSKFNLSEEDLVKSLVDVFDRNQFPNSRELVLRSLNSGSLMLLLDGLDEINSEVRQNIVLVIKDFLTKYSKCRAVITCRTAIYDDQFSDMTDQILEIVEFTDQQMRRFLKAWEREMPKGKKSINQMIATLRERPLILRLARNPLLLTLIAYLYTEPAFVLPRSRADFFDKSTRILLEQRQYKGDGENKHNNSYEADEKRRVLQHLALYIQDHSDELEDRRSLGKLTVRDRIRRFLPSLDLSEQETTGILKEIAERSGLFVKIDADERYLFPHQTIQEYFAAEALVDNEAELISRFKENPSAWQEVVKLWCNLATDSTSLIRAVYEWSGVLGFACLAEARQVDSEFASEVISIFKQRLDDSQIDETLTQAFGAVAANDRQRGKEMYDFLTNVINDQEASFLRRRFAADALSRTNLPKAAEVLVKHYETLNRWDGGRESIIRMGDLVVDGLAQLAKQEVMESLDDLYAIGTSDAAMALIPLLWEKSHEIMIRSAWYLGSLLSRPEVEEALQGYYLEAEQKKSEIWEWVWEPFGNSDSSDLPIIAGRLSYIIQYSYKELSLATLKNLPCPDPRITIPLCIMALEGNEDQLPKEFPLEAETLLEQSMNTAEIVDKCQEMLNRLLNQEPNVEPSWKALLGKLDPRIQLDLLRYLISLTRPDSSWRQHWSRLKEPYNDMYEFRISWHYISILIVSGILSITAIFRLGLEAFLEHNDALIIGLLGFTVVIIVTFWFALWQDESGSFQPNRFSDLGPKGVLTFVFQIKQALRNQLIWPGVTTMYDVLTGEKFGVGTSSSIFVVASALVGTVAGAAAYTVTSDARFAVAGASAFAGAMAGPVVGAVAGAIFGTGADAGAGAGSVSGAIVGAAVGGVVISSDNGGFDASDAGAIIGILACAFAISAAVAALESWRQLDINLDNTLKKIFAFFAFPWFCWFPIVIVLSVWALFDLINSIFNEPVWQLAGLITVLISAGIALFCHILWQRGQELDAKTRNPFRDGFTGASLGVNFQKANKPLLG